MKNIGHPVRAFKVAPPRPITSPASHGCAALRLPDKPSLAVLPFTNMSGDPEQEYFADGITEDIITDVSKISGLFVIARNSSFTFKKQSVDIKDVGRKLGVRHVLEGSVRKAGMRVRINVQLIDAESGGHVWADRYDRDLEDIFLVQDEVTRKIVQTLEVTLTGSERARRQDRGKVNGEAYDYLIRAKSCILQFNAAALAEARAMLERALAIDPGLAQAYAYLAICLRHRVSQRLERPHGERSGTGAWRWRARRARSTPFEAISHHALAVTLMWLRRLDEAESAARRAIELDPNSSRSHGALGNVLHFAGRHEQALESLEQALRLDPEFNLWMHAQGRALFALGRYDEAEATFKRRLIHMPDVGRHARLPGVAVRSYRPSDEARRVWRELMAINPRYTIEHTLRVLPYRDPAPLEQFVEGLRKAGLA